MHPSRSPSAAIAASPPSLRRWRTALAVCAALIAYGSLYPFDLSLAVSGEHAWARFTSQRSLWTSPGDVAGNVLLFMPYGALGMASLRVPRRTASLLAFLLCSGLFAFAVQLAQLWFPPRDPALADVVWNLVGTAAGMACATLALRFARTVPRAAGHEQRLALALIALWVVTQLAPMVPTLDWQAMKDSLKPLLRDPTLDVAAAALTLAKVLAVGCLLAVLVPSPDRVAGRLAALLAVVLALKPFVAGQVVTLSTVLGYAGGCAWWMASWRGPAHRTAGSAMALLFVAASASALSPLELRSEAHAFHALPFEAMLQGSMEANARALLESVFLFATLLWLVHRVGGRVPGSGLVLAAWVLLLEGAQVWLEGRTGDITEPLLVLALGPLVHRIVSSPAQAGRRGRPRPSLRARHARGAPDRPMPDGDSGPTCR